MMREVLRGGKAWLATIAVVAAVVIGLAGSSASGRSPAGPDGWLFSCGGAERSYPRTIFNAPKGAQFRDTPEARALHDLLRHHSVAFLPKRGWHKVGVDERGATFVAGKPTARTRAFEVNFERKRDGSFEYYNSSHSCRPGADPEGEAESSAWRLDPDFPEPRRGDTEIHALVHGSFCNSGQSFADRLEEPMIHIGAARIVIASVESPPPPGTYTCEGIPPEPFVFELPEPIGGRSVFDGSVLPFKERLVSRPPDHRRPARPTDARAAQSVSARRAPT